MALLSALAAALCISGIAPAYADDAADCVSGTGEIRIRGCSRIIESGRLVGQPISPGNLAKAYFNRGIAHVSSGAYDQAIKDYSKVVEINPDDSAAYFNRGSAYRMIGQHDRAIAEYSRAIEIDPQFAQAHNNRGIAYVSKGEIERAIADYDKAIALDVRYAKGLLQPRQRPR